VVELELEVTARAVTWEGKYMKMTAASATAAAA